MAGVCHVARRSRIERAGGWHHVTGRANERRGLYSDDRVLQHFVALLAEMAGRLCLCLHAFVLMDNRYHLLAELTEENLSRV